MRLIKGLRGDHVSLIARTYARHSIRGGSGLMFAFFTLLVGLVIAAIFVTFVEQARDIARKEDSTVTVGEVMSVATERWGAPAVKWVIGTDDDRFATYLVNDKPALISAILLVMILCVPLLAAL